MSDALIEGRGVALRVLTDDDVGERYLGWMTDPDVIRHLESRFSAPTLDSLREWVRHHGARSDTLLLAIVQHDGGLHVGNVKVGPLHPRHGTADVGLLIGDPAARGRGHGAEAIALATTLAFDRLGARKLTASCYADNAASAAAFLRAGWVRDGVRARQCLDDARREQDQIMFAAFGPGS